MTSGAKTPKKHPARNNRDRSVTPSSDNVFTDLGLADAEELLAKADLVHAIQQLVHAKKLSQRAAAHLLGVAQPDLSRIFRGRLDGFSIERLVRMLNALGQDVCLVVQPKAIRRRRATIRTHIRETA